MNTAQPNQPTLDLGFIALPLLCCLLAAVLVGFMSDADRRQPDPDLRQHLEAGAGQVHQFEQLLLRLAQVRDQMVSRLNLAEYRKSNQALEGQIAEARQKLELEEQIAALAAELPGLSNRVATLARQARPELSDEATFMLGDYRGDYVLVECVGDGVVVYPGAVRLPLKPSESQKRRLLDQIERAGFVGLLVRPSGWYNRSFDDYRKWIYAHLDDLEKTSAVVVGRSTFPVESHEPITAYLTSLN